MKTAHIAFALLLPSVAAAQGPPSKSGSPLVAPKSTITLALPGLNCSTSAGAGTFNVEAWSWGASNPTAVGTGGSGSGKASLSDLNVIKAFDACSPALLGLVTKGIFLKLATLTQQDAEGNTTATVALEEVRASSWQASSSTSSAAPAESLSLAFRKICLTDTASGNKLCFDQATQQAN